MLLESLTTTNITLYNGVPITLLIRMLGLPFHSIAFYNSVLSSPCKMMPIESR